jgi:hypothetical protein
MDDARAPGHLEAFRYIVFSFVEMMAAVAVFVQ